MSEFIINGVFWVLALYGLIEIVKTIIDSFTYKDLSTNGVYIIIAAKDQEERIEGFVRCFLSKVLNEKNNIKANVIIADLDSEDQTRDILLKLKSEYKNIEITNWKECKKTIDNIDNNL